jgi:hypothetical protein
MKRHFTAGPVAASPGRACAQPKARGLIRAARRPGPMRRHPQENLDSSRGKDGSMVGEHGSRDYIRNLTELLHTDEDPLWARLRCLLKEKGLDPQTVLLADCFPDDTNFEFGLVVTADRRASQCGFDYLRRPIEEGIFSEWVDLTETYNATPYSTQIATALKMLEASRD